ncbi:hypothetical protein EYF80_050651 [Liparis tanakae]|uniref:Uncharacterized protein n=1 Tax=Liparis tanakae TaxID=230148 RepID=A0A4Z2FDD7_9TELE|nr:hypothetical protein EYF80_050651 [Liparis tanakae]
MDEGEGRGKKKKECGTETIEQSALSGPPGSGPEPHEGHDAFVRGNAPISCRLEDPGSRRPLSRLTVDVTPPGQMDEQSAANQM